MVVEHGAVEFENLGLIGFVHFAEFFGVGDDGSEIFLVALAELLFVFQFLFLLQPFGGAGISEGLFLDFFVQNWIQRGLNRGVFFVRLTNLPNSSFAKESL